jgi:Outer membrane receptor for ferrienterochelin and colicins
VQPTGNLEALFVEDQFKATSWLTLTGGLRYTHFDGQIAENATDPRIGAAIQIPKLKWIVRAAYSYYYQAPPLDTVSGSLIGSTGCGMRISATVRRAGHPAGIRGHDSNTRVGTERNVFSHLGEELLRSRFAGELEHFFAADDTGGSDQRIGNDGAFSAAAEALPGTRRVLEPESARRGSDNGWIDKFYAARKWEFLSRPRPAEHVFCWHGKRSCLGAVLRR